MGQSQKYMAYIMPFFALSGLYWPFGLVLYWVTTNLWTLGQQYVLFTKVPPAARGRRDGGRDGAVTPALPRPGPARARRSADRQANGHRAAPAGSGADCGKQPGNPRAARPARRRQAAGPAGQPASPGKSAGPPRPSSPG